MKKHLTLLATIASLAIVAGCSGNSPKGNDIPKFDFAPTRDLATLSLGDGQSKRTETIFDKAPVSLNGQWDFRFYETMEECLADSAMKAPAHKITVPGNWEVQGFDDPVYVNTPYDFCPHNPVAGVLPDAIPVGVYSKSFKAKVGDNERLYLTICGAKGGKYVYVNGQFVGYSEDAKDAIRYDISSFVRKGSNSLVIAITKWSEGSFLECQDFWRISGIERDVYLSREKTSVPADFDWNVVSTLADDMTTGEFRLTVNGTMDFSYQLVDNDGSVVCRNSEERVDSAKTYTAEIGNVRKWSAETPELYTLVMRVGGMKATAHVGFRRLEIKGDEFFVNGCPVKFKGVNLHEHNQYTGHYTTEEDILQQLKVMRELNINAIRTCHYPQQRAFYELCDSLGFYVFDEANVESHGMGYRLDRTLGNNPEWLPMHMDRTMNMYYRTRNYPCVTILSLGNEAGNGCNFYDTYTALKELEKDGQNRPVCYERAELDWNTDMIIPQYPHADWFKYMGENPIGRPVCPEEYSHAMGNSNGSIDLQWSYVYKYDNLQGGFIWDFIDQGLLEHDENGKAYWAYGGDFGYHRPSDGNFLCNGLVGPDCVPHPGAYEVKHVYQNVAITGNGEGKYTVTNRNYFTSLDKYVIRWTIEAEGQPVASGELDLKTAPQTKEDVAIATPMLPEGKDCYITFKTCLKESDGLIPAGYEVANDQVLLAKAERELPTASADVIYEKNGDLLTLKTDGASVCFDSAKGYLTSYTVDGEKMFDEDFGLRPLFWRAPTDNDYGCHEPKRAQAFKTSSNVFNTTADFEGNAIKVVDSLASGNVFEVTYALCGKQLRVDYNFHGNPDPEVYDIEVPRIGFRMRLPASADAITYFGRGPEENYCDRFSGYMIGLYKSSATDEFVPYVRPQECGHHCDCSMLTAGDLTVTGRDFGFSALRCTVEDLDSEETTSREYQFSWTNPDGDYTDEAAKNNLRRQTHINDVPVRDFVEVCIDGAQTGIGGYDSWWSRPETDRTLWSSDDYNYSMVLSKK